MARTTGQSAAERGGLGSRSFDPADQVCARCGCWAAGALESNDLQLLTLCFHWFQVVVQLALDGVAAMPGGDVVQGIFCTSARQVAATVTSTISRR